MRGSIGMGVMLIFLIALVIGICVWAAYIYIKSERNDDVAVAVVALALFSAGVGMLFQHIVSGA